MACRCVALDRKSKNLSNLQIIFIKTIRLYGKIIQKWIIRNKNGVYHINLWEKNDKN